MNELGNADQHQADPGYKEHREHRNHLCDQPALQRGTDAIDHDGHAGAMPARRHKDQAASIEAGLRRKAQPEKQHDEEIADRADGAENQFERLAEDGAAARCDGAGAGQVMRGCRRRFRGRRARGRRIQIADIEIAGIDAVLLEERLDVHHLRFDGAAQRLGLLGNGGAAEEDHAGQQRRQQQTNRGKPQRMRKFCHAADLVGHRIECDAEQHACEDQKQRRGEIPGCDQQRCEIRRC